MTSIMSKFLRKPENSESVNFKSIATQLCLYQHLCSYQNKARTDIW
jgi:hypothetical protein